MEKLLFLAISWAKKGVVGNHSGFKALLICLTLVGFLDTFAFGQSYGINSRPNVAPFLNGAVPPVSPIVSGTWTAVPAFSGLRFTNAVGLTAVPGTNLLCVWEREGRMWTFVNTSNVTTKKLVLDISNQCQGWDDSGLLGVAFHPGFATNHYVFIYYTWVVPGTVVGDAFTRPPTFSTGAYHDKLVRYTLDTNGVALVNSETVFVDQVGDSVWHNGGGMFFHPTNGFLYWTDGDDADNDNTQIITNNILSGVFRIDVDKRGGSISHAPPRQPATGTTANYFIPNDNPFVGQTNVLEEFFCLGLRSPHRMTEDPGTGRIFIGDVGLSTKEEVDIIEPGESGLNFQWATIEGIGGNLTPPYVGIDRQPVTDYLHTDGNFAVIGGYVYHGSQFASDLAGKYVFGDNGSDDVWVLDESTTPAGKTILCTVPKGSGFNSGNDYTGLSSFGLDANGEIYMCVMGNLGSPLYTLSRAGPTNTLTPPALFSQLGAFTNLATLAPGPALVPYSVNSPLWSDGAVKSRWIALPTNTFINFYPTGEWSFPPGTVFFKNFNLVTNENNPSQQRRLETRLLVRDTNGAVYGASYKWRPDNSDADIVVFSTNEDIQITTATGVRTQTWYYPGRSDCLHCHTPAASGILGAKTRQLNGTNLYPSGVVDNQLRTWNHLGFFTPTQDESVITNYPKLVSVSDTNSTLEIRSRSYFDANCAHCHRPGGVDALFDMRFDTPLANQSLINGYAINALGINGAKIIKPGDTNASVLYHRDSTVGLNQMPPLAKNVVDTNAMAVIATWINSLATQSQLPPPWADVDMGVTLSGTSSYTNGVFNITGGGGDIWNTADTGHFVYQPINGSGQIIARVVGIPDTDPWAKAGVMFRETLDAGSRNVFMTATAGRGMSFQWRTDPGGLSFNIGGADLGTPYWLKLVRAGDVFTGYISPNGVNWSASGSVTNVMSSTIELGMAVNALVPALLNLSQFDNVSLIFSNGQPLYVTASATGGTPTATQQPFQFTAQAFAGQIGKTFGTVTNVNTTADHTGTITAQGENTPAGEVATNAFDGSTATKWLDPTASNPLTHASWIQYQYTNGAQCVVTQYTVSAANDVPARDPRDWHLLGSNDGGNSWATVDARTGETFTNRFDTHTYNSFTNTSGFNIYRFQIDSVKDPANATCVQLSELGFFGTPASAYTWTFGDGTTSTAQNPVHNYTAGGIYNVSVVAFDGVSTATNSFTVTVGLASTSTPQWLPVTAGMTNHKFHINVAGTDGLNYIIDATTNLKTWTPILTNTTSGGLLLFTDVVSTNLPYRFYRAHTP